jgi:hypothetical protein
MPAGSLKKAAIHFLVSTQVATLNTISLNWPIRFFAAISFAKMN